MTDIIGYIRDCSGQEVTGLVAQGMPSIVFYIDQKWVNNNLIRAVLYGIEEESVPVSVVFREGQGNDLAFQASCISKLGVGIGLGSDGMIVLNHVRIPKDKPLFRINFYEAAKTEIRLLGTNSAHLVKGLPLKY